MKRLILCLAAILLTPVTGMTSEMEQRVEVLERRVQALSELVIRMDGLQREMQQLRGELELQSHAMEALKKRQRDLYLDIDSRLSQPEGDAAASSPESPPVEQRRLSEAKEADSGGERSPSPVPQAALRQPDPASAREERDYQNAFQMLTQRRYDEARSAFQAFLKAYPSGPYADNAQYWLGEASYVTRDFDTALMEFKRVIEQYPASSKVSGAMLKIGYIQFEKQQLDEARATLDSLIRRFPDSSAARLAQEFIRKKKFQ